MRVLHVDAGREMRGGQWQVLYLLRELKRRGVDALLLCPRVSPLYEAAQAAGLAVRALRWFDVARLGSKFDLAHAHDARAHTLALFSSRPAKGAMVALEQGAGGRGCVSLYGSARP